MKIQLISIFPEMFEAITNYGVVGRAIQQNVLNLEVHNPRNYAEDKHSTVDGRPYGGGPGMLMLPEPMTKVIEAAKSKASKSAKVIYLSPQGKRFDRQAAKAFSEQDDLILLAGRYEGVDERVIEELIDEEWSIGDYVLSGGELAAMVIIDAVARMLPDSLGNSESVEQDSFEEGLLDCPHYARPEVFDGQQVPQVLLSGDHKAIADWRRQQALGRTWLRRPDLLQALLDADELSKKDLEMLDQFKDQHSSNE